MGEYIVSARKYRPATFESVVGQRALTDTLRNAIRQGKLAHAYLFCGPRGVGKTTCARIFAKTINCLNPSADHDACNECESCVAFNEQRSFNIHELDAASNNSVEDIRQLIQEVRIPPQIGKYSVYIIDEVHMLSTGAFNALLKTLEEPPSYAIFILATTEKHKVLPTILSRCQVYDFQRITTRDIVEHLKYVAEQEGINAEEQALSVVAEKADGGMRDALSIFDQLVAFSGNTITHQQTIQVLNVLDSAYYFKLVDMVQAHQHTDALLLFNEVLQKGFDAGQFIAGLMVHLRNVLMAKDASTLPLLEQSDSVSQQYVQQSGRVAAPWLFEALDIMNTCDINYRTAKNKRLTVELALIKLCRIGEMAQAATQPQPRMEAPKTTVPSTGIQASQTVSTSASSPAPIAMPKQAPIVPPVTAPQAPKTAPKPMVSAPSITIPSIDSIGKSAPVESKNEEKPAEAVRPEERKQNPFTYDQFLDAWTGLVQYFPKEERLNDIFRFYKPIMGDNNTLILKLPNPWLKDAFQQVGSQVMNHIRKAIENDDIHLKVIVEEQQSNAAYTAEERYELLLKKNVELSELKSQLNLMLE